MDAPETTNELLKLIRTEGPDAIARRFRKPPISSQLLREISVDNPSEDVWVFLTTYALTPSSLLEDIGNHCLDYPASVLIPLAQNPRTPPSTLSQLLQVEDANVRAAVATSPNIPAHDAESLLADKNLTVWRAMAANPALKFRAQAILAAQGDASVRLELVQNKSLHPDLLIALSGDPSPLVRYTLVTTATADEEVLQFWADSDREDIQLALLSRSKLPKPIWQSLLMSPHPSVRQAVCAQHKLDEVDLLFLSRSDDKGDRSFVASHKAIPAGLQHKLVQDDDMDICVELAQNPAIWPEVAEFLVTNECTLACLSLLDNPSMPEGLYLELAWLNQPAITATLARHSSTPEEVLQYLANEQFSAVALAHMAIAQRPAPWLRTELANALSQHFLPSLRALAATSRQLSESARNRLRDDPAPRVRTLAYEFPPAPDGQPITARADMLERCLSELNCLIRGDTVRTAQETNKDSRAHDTTCNDENPRPSTSTSKPAATSGAPSEQIAETLPTIPAHR